MFVHPEFDPIAVSIGPVAIRWYGLMYLLAFAQFLLLGRMRVRQQPYAAMKWGFKDVEDILFWGVVGVILGGRLGYVMFYMPDFYLSNPLSIFKLWEGGMSFHGGLMGVITAMLYIAWKQKRTFFAVADMVAPVVPIGLGAGRIGNFINGELWGRTTDLPWAMVFPTGGPDPRHPSQLYQFALEGVALFLLLYWFSKRTDKVGAVSGMFLVGYGMFRIMVETVRQPDTQLGLYWGFMTMGQILSVPMVLIGLYLIFRKQGKQQ